MYVQDEIEAPTYYLEVQSASKLFDHPVFKFEINIFNTLKMNFQ